MDRHYGVWGFRWVDTERTQRQIQVDSNDKPRIRFDIHSSAWIDDEETLTRRGSSHVRHYYLYPPFSREVFLETLELALEDVKALDPVEKADFVSKLSPPWGYGRPKPANWPD